ncbi:MAG TPA: DUF4404 family protein [Anaerolineae bacterium]
MEQQQLREKLTDLHDELAKTTTLDDNTRTILADLKKDIQDLLDQPEPASSERYGSLTSQLRAGLVHFESTHPRLTTAMERAIDALVQMGL